MLCLVAATPGCARMEGSFVEMKPYTHRQERGAAEIELYMEGEKPTRSVKIVGTVRADWPWKGVHANQSEIFQQLRTTASQNGLDGVLGIYCTGVRSNGGGLCSGSGFVYLD